MVLIIEACPEMGSFSLTRSVRVFGFLFGLECSTRLGLSVCGAFDAGRPYYKQERCYGEDGSPACCG